MKVQKTITQNGLETITDYLDGYQYVDEKLQFFPHAEGYVKVNDDHSVIYVFQHKDHLGNIRVSYADVDGNGVINPNTEILQENNYYPFGLQHKGYNNNVNNLAKEYNS